MKLIEGGDLGAVPGRDRSRSRIRRMVSPGHSARTRPPPEKNTAPTVIASAWRLSNRVQLRAEAGLNQLRGPHHSIRDPEHPWEPQFPGLVRRRQELPRVRLYGGHARQASLKACCLDERSSGATHVSTGHEHLLLSRNACDQDHV